MKQLYISLHPPRWARKLQYRPSLATRYWKARRRIERIVFGPDHKWVARIWGHHWKALRPDARLEQTSFWDCLRATLALALRHQDDRLSDWDTGLYSERAVAWGNTSRYFNGEFDCVDFDSLLVDERWWAVGYTITRDGSP